MQKKIEQKNRDQCELPDEDHQAGELKNRDQCELPDEDHQAGGLIELS
jgi:hypothetical protein